MSDSTLATDAPREKADVTAASPTNSPAANQAADSDATTPQTGNLSKRPLPAIAKRLLIIGLDGATFDVLDPMMDSGRMPHLKAFIDKGVAGVLRSTQPPITPAAWTTFMTGKGPGKHGIIDFEKYSVEQGRLSFNSTYEIREKTIWDILSEKGLHVGSINVPMTYPPRPVNGFMISGFETPSADAEFTYPKELKQKIFEVLPNYNYRTNWQRRPLGGEDVLTTNLNYIAGSFDQGATLTEFCGQQYGWDVMMLVYKLVDNLQHKAWKYLDPRFNHRFPTQAELAAKVFTRLDDNLGRLFKYAEENEASVMIMSDHGHGSLDGKAQANLLLKQWGYLTLHSPFTRARTRAGHLVHRLTKGKVTRFEQGSRGIEAELAVDWTKTKACVMHAGIYGFLYINRTDSGPHGVVDPADYEQVRDDLIAKFRNATVRDPSGQSVHVFPEVYKTEQLYGCSREDNPDLPDLMLVPRPGLAVVRKIRGSKAVRWTAVNRIEGTHRVEGVMALGGPHVRTGARLDANIADLTPTALAMLGLRVPADMEGSVIQDAFDAPLRVEHEPPIDKAAETHEEVYSAEDERILQQRLSDLGYLE
jgi:predicted AlkP superfamily phosphohydrolase/phosphomutase